jgi:hypothetical protein
MEAGRGRNVGKDTGHIKNEQNVHYVTLGS